MQAAEIAGIVSGVVAGGAAIAAVAQYLGRLLERTKSSSVETEAVLLRDQVAQLQAKHSELVSQLAVSRRAGDALLAKKMLVDEELRNLIELTSADSGSIYAPVLSRDRNEPTGFAFLSILPPTEETRRLRYKVIPPKSLAGHCYKTGKPSLTQDSGSSPEHFRLADRASGYRTRDMMSIPLIYQEKPVGVLQLINKKDAGPFTASDLADAVASTALLARHVAELTCFPENLEALGIAPDRAAQPASVMFCDLSNSALLFREMDPGTALSFLNEFFERLTDVALTGSGTLDKYIGDGVMFHYNVARRVPDHSLRACADALRMLEEFGELKSSWGAMGHSIDSLHVRIGIATGVVYSVVLGHPQFREPTILGDCVNRAAGICESAPRDRCVVVIDGETHTSLSDAFITAPFASLAAPRKASSGDAAYELLSNTGS